MPHTYSSAKKLKAISLRKKGKSLRSVAEELNIALSTAQFWTKQVKLSKIQKLKIASEHKRKLNLGRDKYIKLKKTQKDKKESKIFTKAESEVQNRKQDSFFIMGLTLYWAEGFKKDHSLGFVNSDPKMVKAFLSWLRVYGKINLKDVRLRVQIHQTYKSRISEVESYWSKLLKIPTSQFQAPFFQQSKSKPNFIDPQYKGLLRIRVVDARDLFVKILGWLEGLRSRIW